MIPPPEEKAELYALSLAQLREVLREESDPLAVMSSVVCILKTNLPHFFWVGFYRVDPQKPDELVVGPYQGTFGCLRIPFGRGVCGLCAARELPVIVPNVNDFEDHIACDSRSASEIVVPVYGGDGKLFAVFDVDATELDAFSDEDCEGLETLMAEIQPKL
ncbi:MAG: GAF domain-containing protein [Candidatus Zixiibacteriota bacterium]|nr:MAG: GAF domain-containing protein [candidate division Zixibacteria bacterium]